MDRGVWRATVHEVANIEHDLATKPTPPMVHCSGVLHVWSIVSWIL